MNTFLILANVSIPNLFLRKSANNTFRLGDVGVLGLNSILANDGFF